MSGWTPGPWEAVWNERPGRWEIWMNTKTKARNFTTWIADIRMGEAPVEQEPTARLIAAAPEMFDQLCSGLAIHEDDHECGWTRKTRALLARIEGE